MEYVQSEQNQFRRRKRSIDNDRDIVITSEDNRQFVVKNLLPTDFKNQTLAIARDVIVYYCTKPFEFEPAPSRTAKIMRNLVDDQLSDRQSFMNDLANKLPIDSSKDLYLLDAVAEQMFTHEEITWSRIVTFYAFVSIVAKNYLEKKLQNNKHVNINDNIGEWNREKEDLHFVKKNYGDLYKFEGREIDSHLINDNIEQFQKDADEIDVGLKEVMSNRAFNDCIYNNLNIDNNCKPKEEQFENLEKSTDNIKTSFCNNTLQNKSDTIKDYSLDRSPFNTSSNINTGDSLIEDKSKVILPEMNKNPSKNLKNNSERFDEENLILDKEEGWIFVENCWKALTDIVVQRLGVWMSTNGGWASFDKQFPLICIFDQSSLFKIILFILILSASVVAFYFFIHRSDDT